MHNPPNSAYSDLCNSVLAQLAQAGAVLADIGPRAEEDNLVSAWAEQVAAALAAARLDDLLPTWQQARLWCTDHPSSSRSADRLATLRELLERFRIQSPRPDPHA